MKIAIVGVGRLGSVFARILSKKHSLILIDKNPDSISSLGNELSCKISSKETDANDCDLIVLCVKPSYIQEVVSKLNPQKLIVSSAAGISINKLESYGSKSVIRIMPNICAEVSSAFIAYSYNENAKSFVGKFLEVFSDLGLCILVDESKLDPITAVSGSGPAFLAYIAQTISESAISEGLDKKTAELAIAQTMLGTAKLLLNGWDTNKIISTVASPGGTTEAGLKLLDSEGVKKTINKMIKNSIEKARELGR